MSKNTITPDTTIQLTLKMLLSLLGGMIVLFYGFYGLVISPKIKEHDEKIIKIEETHTKTIKELNNHLMEINSGLGNLNGAVEGINTRFSDLRDLRDDENTAGGFN